MTGIKKFFVAMLFAALLSLVFAEIETLTLQQGVDGYSGCEDTFLIGEDDSQPQGDSTELTLHGYH